MASIACRPATYTASWTDLAPATKYLGQIVYGDTGSSTLLQVVTGEAGPSAPVNTALPTIEGTVKVGKRVTANPGEWDVAGLAFTYQWQVAGADVAGATKATYRIASSDAGKPLTVVVTATAVGSPPGTATSAPVTVAPRSPEPLAAWVGLDCSQRF